MSMEYLEKLVRKLPEFRTVGGAEKHLSFPLFRETKQDAYVVHMVYTGESAVPSGFVLTPLTVGEPEYKSIAESLRLLELTAEDFDRFEEEDEAPAGDRKELSEYTIGSFYSLIADPGFDRETYAGYVDAILPYVAPKSRKYYRAFQPGFSET